jgi:hypothetical protein
LHAESTILCERAAHLLIPVRLFLADRIAPLTVFWNRMSIDPQGGSTAL